MFDVVTIGSATRDNFLKMEYEVIDWPKTQSRKAIVFPWGEKFPVDEVYSTVGGNAANASVTFARQGFKTACVAKIGDDIAGKEFLVQLQGEKVAVNLISQAKGMKTAYSALLLNEGERTILNYHGASNSFSLKDLPLSKMKAKWWYISLSGESDRMYLDLLAFAKKNGIKVAFNPSGHHLKHGRKEILGSLSDLSFLVLNEGEAADLVGIPFEDEKAVFEKLDDLMPGIVAVTDGANGVTVSDGVHVFKAGIFKEKKIEDRTGAGDSFGSGFVAGLMQRERKGKLFTADDIRYAIRLATANATANVEFIGATEGVLTKKEFETSPRWRHLPIQITAL